MDARSHQYFSQTRASLKVKSIAVQSIVKQASLDMAVRFQPVQIACAFGTVDGVLRDT